LDFTGGDDEDAIVAERLEFIAELGARLRIGIEGEPSERFTTEMP
jgi:hypothetical protein